MPIVGIIISGIVGAFNRLLVTGLVGKAIFGVIFFYVISVLLKAVTDIGAPYFLRPDFQAAFAGLGFYWDYFKLYHWVNFILPAVAVSFIIRRLPVVG